MKKNINMKNKNIILQSTYRKYKEWSATKYHDLYKKIQIQMIHGNHIHLKTFA